MKEKAQELRLVAVKKAQPLVEQLVSEGMTAREIENLGKSIIESFISQMYRQEDGEHVKWIIDELMRGMLGKPLDSKAEAIMYRDLVKNDISFDFQVEIGAYRVDFLIYPGLIVELDGPQHDQPEMIEYDEKRDAYLEKMGFCVLRIPLHVYATVPEEVISTIKDYVNSH